MNRKQSHAWLTLSVIVCTLAVPIIFALNAKTHSMEQEEGRLIERRDDFNPPVKIGVVKSRIGIIEMNKKINTADDDWLKGLTIRVHNLSGKTVTHVLIRLQFVRPKEQSQERDLMVPLEYGPSPFRPSEQESSAQPPIPPGKTAEITWADSEYDSLRPILNELNYPATIKRVRVFVGAIGFSDGTTWQAGRIFKRDPDHPEKWIPIDKPQEGTKAGMRNNPLLFIKDFYAAHGRQFTTCGHSYSAYMSASTAPLLAQLR